MTDHPLRPDEFEISDAEGDEIKLSFRADSGGIREVILRKAWAADIVTQILQKIGSGRLTPIDRGSLQIGQSFAVQGWQVQHRQDGSRRLVLAVDLLDQGRTVTIPLEFSPSDVLELLKQLA